MRRLVLALVFLCLATISADAAARFLVACTSTCTWDNSSTLIWSTTSGGAAGSAAPTSADAVTLDANSCVGGVTCTITVNANLNISSLTMGACTASTTGCILDFSVNNNSFAATSVSLTGTGVRTLKMGSGVWTITGTGTIWTTAVTTNLTFTPSTSNLRFQASSQINATMATANGLAFGHITILGFVSNPAAGIFTFPNNTFTIGTLDIIAPNLVSFPVTPAVLTITNPINWTGTGTNPLRLGAFNATSANNQSVTLTNGGTISFASIYNVAFTGSPTATNSMDQGLNTGITITGFTGGGACILGGWLLWRDMPEHLNDNFPAWLEKTV